MVSAAKTGACQGTVRSVQYLVQLLMLPEFLFQYILYGLHIMVGRPFHLQSAHNVSVLHHTEDMQILPAMDT